MSDLLSIYLQLSPGQGNASTFRYNRTFASARIWDKHKDNKKDELSPHSSLSTPRGRTSGAVRRYGRKTHRRPAPSGASGGREGGQCGIGGRSGGVWGGAPVTQMRRRSRRPRRRYFRKKITEISFLLLSLH